jgi:hypothetical protein
MAMRAPPWLMQVTANMKISVLVSTATAHRRSAALTMFTGSFPQRAHRCRRRDGSMMTRRALDR